MRTVAVIQARMGSQRLPGKSLAPIGREPLLAWTISSVHAIPDIATVVVATTTDPSDDPLVELVERLGVPVHRGSTNDVLGRCWAAVQAYHPDVVIRQTGDNPFSDPVIAAAQVERLVAGQFDYVGIAGWPLGIAVEVCRGMALQAAALEATAPAEREHVTPFIYRHPERFRIGTLDRVDAGPPHSQDWRYTVDTTADLEFARQVAELLPHPAPVHLHELEAILVGRPEIARVNAQVEQRSWRVVDERTVPSS